MKTIFERVIAEAEAALNKATTDAERDAAQKDLAIYRKDKEDALAARKKGEEALAAAQTEEPGWIQEHDVAVKALDDGARPVLLPHRGKPEHL